MSDIVTGRTALQRDFDIAPALPGAPGRARIPRFWALLRSVQMFVSRSVAFDRPRLGE
jgi:hypothetical protein